MCVSIFVSAWAISALGGFLLDGWCGRRSVVYQVYWHPGRCFLWSCRSQPLTAPYERIDRGIDRSGGGSAHSRAVLCRPSDDARPGNTQGHLLVELWCARRSRLDTKHATVSSRSKQPRSVECLNDCSCPVMSAGLSLPYRGVFALTLVSWPRAREGVRTPSWPCTQCLRRF